MDRQRVPAFLALVFVLSVVLGMIGACEWRFSMQITNAADAGRVTEGDL